jgi:hypothetical protein
MSVIDIQPLLNAIDDPRYLEKIFELEGRAAALAASDDQYLDLPDAVFGVLAAVMKKDAAELRRAILDLMDETERLWPGEMQRAQNARNG